MQNILVTGANGFIGKNLCFKLSELEKFNILKYDINNTEEELQSFIEQADVIFHLAGVNRPKNEDEFTEGNFDLTNTIIKHWQNSSKAKKLIFSSSTQAELDNPYGKSKKAAEDSLISFAKEFKKDVMVYRLTNVFGKWCRPNYNSVVATFCHNIANKLPIQVNNEAALLKLIYIDDIVNSFISQIDAPANTTPDIIRGIEPVHEITLGKLAELVQSFRESRNTLFLPEVDDPFTKKLYSTYLSYLPKNEFSYKLNSNTDDRGDLTELLKSNKIGQFFVSTTKPGITRGNHYHHTKTEKFVVIRGEAVIQFRKIDSDEVLDYPVSGKEIEVVDIPPGYTHNIKNVGDEELITLFWANEVFDKENPDTKWLTV